MAANEFVFPHANGSEPAVIAFTPSIDEAYGADWWRKAKLDEMRVLWAEQGAALESALRSTVSGGLYDALFAAMAARKASLLIVSHASLEEK